MLFWSKLPVDWRIELNSGISSSALFKEAFEAMAACIGERNDQIERRVGLERRDGV